MADDTSPWASPQSDFQVSMPATSPGPATPATPGTPTPGTPAPGTPAPGPPAPGTATPGTPAGAVTGMGAPQAGGQPPHVTPRRRHRTLALFGWTAAALVPIGLVVVLIMAFNGTFSTPGRGLAGFGGGDPGENVPPLAKLCPPPTAAPTEEYAEPEPPPPGPRTVDEKAGISYAAYADPWEPWRDDWSGGDLNVHYRTGQHFVTETYSGGTYHASILSGSVPATVNDGFSLNLTCTGRQVVADVRRSYYPEPNRQEMIRDEQTMLGGRPAWVSVFRLHFDKPGLKAKNELVGVVLMDVGRVDAAVLYVSIPGTHRQFDHVVADVINSIRPMA